MPEFRECLAHYLFLHWLWHNHKSSYVLLALWADLTDAEVKHTGQAKNGLVQKLGPTCTFKRGSRGGQTCIYPPTLQRSKINQHPASLITLELREIGHNPRAIFLDFGSLRLKLSYLTHTSIQFYKRSHWETSVIAVPKSQRGKIGLALEFKEYIIAFITNDLVFQPVWETRSKEKPLLAIPPPIYDDYVYFLSGISAWIEKRAEGVRQGLACEVIRSAQDVWCGVGVYTVCELFFDAGISPFLTEVEVFDCPSRTARLCEAFYSYARYSQKNLLSLLKPAAMDGVLAPTQEQRLKYMHWLHVYGKDKTSVPKRMADLLRTYKDSLEYLGRHYIPWYRDSKTHHLYDVFDPIYIRDAFEKKDINLGHLIFGDELWKQLDGPVSCASDPLSDMFQRRGLISSSTHLNLNHYTDLYPIQDRSGYQFPSTYVYGGAQKQIWSITPSFPSNSFISEAADECRVSRHIFEYVGEERTRRLFKTIVTDSQSVSIGPLEYCGNGRIIRLNSGKKKLAIVHRSDPQLSRSQVIKQAKREFRQKHNINLLGKAKKSMTEKQWAAQQKFIDKAILLYQTSLSITTEETGVDDSSDGAISSDVLSSLLNRSSPHPPSSSPLHLSISSLPVPSSSSPSPLPLSISPSPNFVANDLTNSHILPPPAKKRRISQDQRVALFGHEDLDSNPQPMTRLKRRKFIRP